MPDVLMSFTVKCPSFLWTLEASAREHLIISIEFSKVQLHDTHMRYLRRRIEQELTRASRHFPALILTGPRRAGKTTLLRHLFPRASYHLLEDPDHVARFRADPRAFVDDMRPPVILDEIQNVPEILNYIRSRIDKRPSQRGQWLLTGSQEAALMKGVTESMAGRAATFQLLPLAVDETQRISLLSGGFPEVLARPLTIRQVWFRSYVQTYLERDVRAVSSVRDLATFCRFLSLVTSRTGQLLNKTELAAPLGVSVPTITEWLSILEITGQIGVVPPYFENFGKRLIKSPKIYLVDSGLACHLLGIEREAELTRSTFLGPIFEGFVAAEIVKHQINAGRRRELYFFRDEQGLEVDFLVPGKGGRLALLEAKASRTVTPRDGESMTRLARAIQRRTLSYVVHQPAKSEQNLTVLRPGVKALSVPKLLEALP
jgi:predicted AAA+ superfamily ATPase